MSVPVVMEAAEQNNKIIPMGNTQKRSSTACPACGQNVESLSHLMFDRPATSAQRDTMLDKIRSVLRQVVGGAERLRNVLALSDASIKLLRFVSAVSVTLCLPWAPQLTTTVADLLLC
jgi:hypothetical protein